MLLACASPLWRNRPCWPLWRSRLRALPWYLPSCTDYAVYLRAWMCSCVYKASWRGAGVAVKYIKVRRLPACCCPPACCLPLATQPNASWHLGQDVLPNVTFPLHTACCSAPLTTQTAWGVPSVRCGGCSMRLGEPSPAFTACPHHRTRPLPPQIRSLAAGGAVQEDEPPKCSAVLLLDRADR